MSYKGRFRALEVVREVEEWIGAAGLRVRVRAGFRIEARAAMSCCHFEFVVAVREQYWVVSILHSPSLSLSRYPLISLPSPTLHPQPTSPPHSFSPLHLPVGLQRHSQLQQELPSQRHPLPQHNARATSPAYQVSPAPACGRGCRGAGGRGDWGGRGARRGRRGWGDGRALRGWRKVVVVGARAVSHFEPFVANYLANWH